MPGQDREFVEGISGNFPRLFSQGLNDPEETAIPPAMAEKHLDLTISLPRPGHTSFAAFAAFLARECSQRNLSFQVIHDGTVVETLRNLRAGMLTIGYHLDFFSLWHIPRDPYAELAQTIQDQGGIPVNPPARARALTDKANAHGELFRKGLGVPDTLIMRPQNRDDLTAPALNRFLQKRLGAPPRGYFLKTANGFGGKGLTYFRAAEDMLTSAIMQTLREARDDAYLLQTEIEYPFVEIAPGVHRPAYWRIIHCLEESFPFWWKPAEFCRPGEMSYLPLTPEQVRQMRLQPLLDYSQELAELGGLDWFSTELCLAEEPVPSRHQVRCLDGKIRPVVAIDYFNDQCHVDVQSRWHGAPPDAIVEALARKFVGKALALARLFPQNLAA
ncbi:MAG: hypothetical protein EXR99_15865 [Gemmataceae bacterium]|nr:hypothetical protein [Gemmataceae bacterium]